MDLEGWCFESTDFDYNKAHWLAKLSTLAYAQPLTARKILKKAEINKNIYFDKDGAQAYGIEKNGIIFLDIFNV